VPDWRPGDTIPLRRGRKLRVVATVASEDGVPSVLVVEDVA
jgi:hypothetical protein